MRREARAARAARVLQYRISMRYLPDAFLRPPPSPSRPHPAVAGGQRPALIGDLRIEECRDEELKRSLRTALLWDERSVLPSAERPRLLDVHIIGMSPQAFTLSGFERIDDAEYMQSWIVARCD